MARDFFPLFSLFVFNSFDSASQFPSRSQMEMKNRRGRADCWAAGQGWGTPFLLVQVGGWRG
jgi:hypothetical protein